ncbi:MAG TPA: DoxX family protein [Chthoniobacterales bacterium]
MVLTWLTKYREFGLLLLRIGLGVMFFYHGWPKLSGGPEVWTKVGSAMSAVGVTFLPVFWGFMAAFSETVGAVLLVLGFLFRPACMLLTITMAVALTMHLKHGDDFANWSHAAELGIVFLSLLLIGPGKFSVDRS